MKALIIQTAFIGDVILATPVISELHRCLPDAEIDVLVRKGNESLLSNFEGIHKVIIWDKKKSKTKNLFSLLSGIRSEKYDIVINLQRFFSTGILTAFSNAGEKIGFDKNPLSFLFSRRIPHLIDGSTASLHETERNLQLIAHLGARSQSRPVLYPSALDFSFIENYKSTPYVCIAPTSVWYTKQVPAEKWIELILSIRESAFTGSIYLLGGPDDAENCRSLIEKSGDTSIQNLAGKLSFLQTAALMKSAQMNYVNDSAPLHIASAMNAPVTAFYCSTVPAFGFGPLSDRSFIVETNGLDCRPCGLHGFKACPKAHFNCALQLNMSVKSTHLPS